MGAAAHRDTRTGTVKVRTVPRKASLVLCLWHHLRACMCGTLLAQRMNVYIKWPPQPQKQKKPGGTLTGGLNN
jgi:hypothetical protein